MFVETMFVETRRPGSEAQRASDLWTDPQRKNWP